MPVCSELYDELKGVQPHLLTRKEYAAIVYDAAQKAIKKCILKRAEVKQALRDWEKANPSPKPARPSASNSEHAQAKYLWEEHRDRWYFQYQHLYSCLNAIHQLKRTIMLARFEILGIWEQERQNPDFAGYFGHINCPLFSHGQLVFFALYQGLEVPEHVLAEWPEGVAQVRKEMAEKAAWEKANPQYA